MRYVEARLNLYEREDSYRIYVTDVIKMISESASRINGGTYKNISWTDIVDPKPISTEPPKSAEEIALELTERLGLTITGKGDNDVGT